MIIHQAIYGNSGGGHGLLLHSGGGGIPFAEIAWRTDLPGTVPVGVGWEPFFSGFPFAEHYVLVKTFPDTTASRGGMVLSHALIAPMGEVIRFPAFDRLAALFLNAPNRPSSLAVADLRDESTSVLAPPAGSNELADALISLERKTPVVWIGQAGFHDAMLFLWSRLWPAARRRFQFRLSFGPQDCRDLAPDVVCTPASLESRWEGHRLICLDRAAVQPSGAAQYFLDSEEGNALRQFAQDIGSRLEDFKDLARLQECKQYAGKETTGTIDDRLALIRLLARLSPHAGEGEPTKNRAVLQLADSIREMTPNDIRKLRNLDLTAFTNPTPIWDALRNWVEVMALGPPRSDAEVAQIVAEAAPDAKTVAAWKATIFEGLQRASARSAPALATAIWRWCAQNPPLVDMLLRRFPLLQDALAAACPASLSRPVAEMVLSTAGSQEWYCLHGVAAAAGFEPEMAVERQLRVDRAPTFLTGLQCALGRATGRQVVDAALRWQDSRLVELAARACASEPALVEEMAVENLTWQTIWSTALEQKPEVWQPRKEFERLLSRLLDLMLSGGNVAVELWAALARTRLGDLSAQHRRAEAWRRLPTGAVPLLLNRTADGWLERFASNPESEEPESELRKSIVQEHRLAPFLQSLIPTKIGAGVKFFRRFVELSESRFETWLDTVVSRTTTRDVPISDAELIGRFITQREWKRAALKIAAAVKERRQHFGPALRECSNLLSLWDRIKMSLWGGTASPQISSGDLWQMLEETAIELYPEGPNEDELWSRAGGSKAVLRLQGTGKDRWHETLNLLRQGGGKISVRRLLGAMLGDFQHNERLRWLIQQHEFSNVRED